MKRTAALRNRHFHQCLLGALLSVFTGLTLVAAAGQNTSEQDAFDRYFGLYQVSPEKDDWTRHFRIGAMAGLNIHASFNENGLFKIPTANGVYDDGYVREDQTGNAGGLTSNWGYNNASQYDPNAGTITMHSTSSYSTAGASHDEGGAFVGFDMAYGGNLWYWHHVRIGWDLGFGLLPISVTDKQTLQASATQTAYTFNTGGIVVPGAGHQGGSSGVGALLPALPSEFSTNTLSGTASGSREINVILYSVRFGPSIYCDLSQNLGFSLGAGPALGIVSGDYKFNEIVTTSNGSAHVVGRYGATDVVFGGYVNGTLMYHLQDNNRNADLYLGVQYMPMGDATFGEGGRVGRLNLSGQVYLSAGINWPF